MRIKPILFNTEMVQAIQEGRKKVTRRLVKPQPKHLIAVDYHDEKKGWRRGICTENGGNFPAPYQPGDILYVRETWRIWRAHRYGADAHIEFKAGGEGIVLRFPHGNTDSTNRDGYDSFTGKWGVGGKWHPSIHMPKEAARFFLRVQGVRAERLQDITAEQVLDEGVEVKFPEPKPGYVSFAYTEMRLKPAARKQFAELWDSTLKKPSDIAIYGWGANPWVWVIEFERCEKPKEEQR